jgi:serine/threonine-protein kinase
MPPYLFTPGERVSVTEKRWKCTKKPAAGLAGCGQSMDAKSLCDKELGRLRRQALDWLQADLSAWRKLLEKNQVRIRALVQQKMKHWQRDKDFDSVRGPDALNRLPGDQRLAWQKLWQEVEALRKSAAGSK